METNKFWKLLEKLSKVEIEELQSTKRLEKIKFHLQIGKRAEINLHKTKSKQNRLVFNINFIQQIQRGHQTNKKYFCTVLSILSNSRPQMTFFIQEQLRIIARTIIVRKLDKGYLWISHISNKLNQNIRFSSILNWKCGSTWYMIMKFNFEPILWDLKLLVPCNVKLKISLIIYLTTENGKSNVVASFIAW